MAEKIRTRDATIIWHEKDIIKALDGETMKRMQMALVYLQNKTRRNVSVTATIISSGEVVTSRKHLKELTERKEPLRMHSKPGEFPFVITGQLRRRIFKRGPYTKRFKILGDVGTSLDYGMYHELNGRSYLRRTVSEEQKKIAEILSTHIGGKGVTKAKGPGYRYSAAEIASVRSMHKAGKSISEIARTTGMSSSHVRNVVRGRSRTRGK